VLLGLAVGGAQAGLAAGRLAVLPLRALSRAPGVRAPLGRIAGDLAHIATSPQVVAAVGALTQTLTDDMVASVRERAHVTDDIAERTVRGWLRRPRLEPS